jgi:hypothetical protein
MTRAERLERAAARAKAALETQRKALAKIQAAQEEEEKKARTKRRLHVGMLADQAGLLVLDDVTLAVLFSLVATLLDAPDPVALLDGLLSDSGGTPGRVVPGCASPAESVSTAC